MARIEPVTMPIRVELTPESAGIIRNLTTDLTDAAGRAEAILDALRIEREAFSLLADRIEALKGEIDDAR
jgi:hypothetical protein